MKYISLSVVLLSLFLQPRLTLGNQEQEKATASKTKVPVE
jgi:hypothetical protein